MQCGIYLDLRVCVVVCSVCDISRSTGSSSGRWVYLDLRGVLKLQVYISAVAGRLETLPVGCEQPQAFTLSLDLRGVSLSRSLSLVHTKNS